LKKLLVIIPILALSACVVQPKEGTETLRVVGDNHECEVIAVVVGEGANEGAINQVRNRAVAAGANAIYFADTHSKIWGSMVVADALKC
jgi:argininosuccinate synthase